MRILSFGQCVGIGAVSGITFLIGSGIAANTYLTDSPAWERQCSVTGEKSTVTINCGADKLEYVTNKLIVSAIAPQKISVACKGYQTRGIFGGVSFDCTPPTTP